MNATAIQDCLRDRMVEITPGEFEVLCKMVLIRRLDTQSLRVTAFQQDEGVDIEGLSIRASSGRCSVCRSNATRRVTPSLSRLSSSSGVRSRRGSTRSGRTLRRVRSPLRRLRPPSSSRSDSWRGRQARRSGWRIRSESIAPMGRTRFRRSSGGRSGNQRKTTGYPQTRFRSPTQSRRSDCT